MKSTSPVVHTSLTLCVTGRSHRTAVALGNLTRILDQVMPGQYDLTTIDVLDDPKIAEEQWILATPTLVRTSPLPTIRFVGDFSNLVEVLQGLGVSSAGFESLSTGEQPKALKNSSPTR